VFSTERTVTLKNWTNSYHFAKSSKSVLNLTDYYIPADTKETVTKIEIQKYIARKDGYHSIMSKICNLGY
jgi:hypothetical protein